MLRFFTKQNRPLSTLNAYKATSWAISSPSKHVIKFDINRTEKKNALHLVAWQEMKQLFDQASKDQEVRAVILSAKYDEGGKPVWCGGIDVGSLFTSFQEITSSDDPARRFIRMKEMLLDFQSYVNSIENCRKPVIASVRGAAVGGAIDILSACDIRYIDKSAWFTIKEVDIGLAADLGTLQRMHKICGNESTVKELALTARNFYADEAKEIGFVSSIADDEEILNHRVNLVAATIAEKSPVAVQGTKICMNYARDHTVAESLDQMATWNGACLLSEDLIKSASAMMQKQGPADVEYDGC